MSDVLLSTTPSLEGYVITEYLGIVSAEAIYKLSLGKALTTTISNALDSMKIFSNNELSGTTQIIAEAKEYVIGELIKKATAVGANAIVGIDIESSVSGDGVAKGSINGTAVKIIKLNGSTSSPATQKYPVYFTNTNLPFRSTMIAISSTDLQYCFVLDLFCPATCALTGILADISLTDIFDNVITLTDVPFTDFAPAQNNQTSGSGIADKPNAGLATIKNISVIIKKYILDNTLVVLSEEDISTAESGDSFSPYELITVADSCESANQVLEFLQQYNKDHGYPIDSSLIEKIEDLARFERIYGSMQKSAQKALREYFSN